MYLTVPESHTGADIRIRKGRAATLVDGTKFMISIPAEHSPQALYTFSLGDKINPLAPAHLNLVDRARAMPRRPSAKSCRSRHRIEHNLGHQRRAGRLGGLWQGQSMRHPPNMGVASKTESDAEFLAA
jgi:hypothetical protein